MVDRSRPAGDSDAAGSAEDSAAVTPAQEDVKIPNIMLEKVAPPAVPNSWSVRHPRLSDPEARLRLDRLSVAEQLIEVYALADELHAVTDRLRTSVGTALETLRGESA